MTALARRLLPLAALGVASACLFGAPHAVPYGPESDDAMLDLVTGTWQGRDGYALVLCDDAAESFCAADECAVKNAGRPCHEVRRDGGKEVVTFEPPSPGTTCYGRECDCWQVRTGMVVGGVFTTPADAAVPVTGRASLESREGEVNDRMRVDLDAGASLYGTFLDGKLDLVWEYKPYVLRKTRTAAETCPLAR